MIRLDGVINMRVCQWVPLLLILLSLAHPCVAWGDVDVSGVWQSSYDFGPMQETMMANIQQVDNNLVGSFSVETEPSGGEYSGIIFGTIDGDKIRAYYLSVRDLGGDDPSVSISFTDGTLKGEDTIEGTFYYQDSDLNEISGPYDATRI